MTDQEKMKVVRDAAAAFVSAYDEFDGDPSCCGGELFAALVDAIDATGEPPVRMAFEKDDDGHWYLIPADKKEEFQRWMDFMTKDPDGDWTGYDFDPHSLGGSPFVYSFIEPLANLQ